jgi:hypothetical protein
MMLHPVRIDQKGKELHVMVGRKRKSGRRYRNGRLAQEKALDIKAIAAAMPHRRMLPAEGRHGQRAESAFGRLRLVNMITEDQYLAGESFRDIIRRYRAVIESPNPSPGSAALDGMFRGGAVLSDEEAIKRRERYQRAFESIHGHRKRVVIRSVLGFDKPLDQDDLPHLRGALDDLVAHFGLTRARQIA